MKTKGLWGHSLGGITTFIDGIAKIVSGLIKDVFTNIGQADFGGLFQLAGAFATGGIGIGIKKFFDSMSDAFAWSAPTRYL